MNKYVIAVAVLTMTFLWAGCQSGTVASGDSVANAVKMANSDMVRNPEPWMIDFRDKPKWEYTHGLMMLSYLELYKVSGDEKYLKYVQEFVDLFLLEDGEILTYKSTDYNIDRINPGKFLIELFQITGDSAILPAIEKLRGQMRQHPRTTEGGFWHKKVYPHQMWLDGLYMGAPFLAQYASVFGEPELFSDVALQFQLVDNYMYDPAKGLYYHGWDESRQQQWADPETGLSPNFWGRSIGWLAMGLVDALSWFPEDHSDVPEMKRIIRRLAEGVVKYQNPETGLWSQVMDQPEREGNYEEATASVMLTYFLLKGVRLGYLDSYYLNYAHKSYQGIMDHLLFEDEQGLLNLQSCCAVAGLGGNPYRNGTYEYYISEPVRDNDPKGVGPFILASIEMSLVGEK